MSQTNQQYIATGGNRHSSAADWSSDLLAFGAGNNIALWNPEQSDLRGIHQILKGHTSSVNAVRIWNTSSYGRIIVSGASDQTVRLWQSNNGQFCQWLQADAHETSVNTISTFQDTNAFITGGADARIKVWNVVNDSIDLVQTIQLRPRFLPLTTAATVLSDGSHIVAIAGTTNIIQIYSRSQSAQFELQATLTGHEGWIRSLDWAVDRSDDLQDVVLASASQDKFIRLWRLRRSDGDLNIKAGSLLSNKTYPVRCGDHDWTMWYDALLVGHEDWIYTVRWTPTSSSPKLLSASADNSLSIWTKESSGLWLCTTRLGEISSQKGSTTATGSVGGFWIGLWSPDARNVVSLGKTGSWRRWTLDDMRESWQQAIGISGHVKEVQQLSWSPDGKYLLTTSSDQTSRLLSEWSRASTKSWHEVGRPQIHGYDLNCIAALTEDKFVSAAEEKLLRVFDQPKHTEQLLLYLSGLGDETPEVLTSAATIPVLGLSNKAVESTKEGEEGEPETTVKLDKPPTEDFLSRQSLWPEHEKLYGHGYEISALAVAPSASVIATACKASTIDHAVIRLFETATWREVKPPLKAHTLTITSLAFSSDDQYLLSVGRDRQLAVFKKDKSEYTLFHANQKAHSRMILDCSWSAKEHVFATAGRDKVVKIWQIKDNTVEQISSISSTVAVTAVAFSTHDERLLFGTENGDLVLADAQAGWQTISIDNQICPSSAITSIAWRPGSEDEVAIASEDTAVRILKIS